MQVNMMLSRSVSICRNTYTKLSVGKSRILPTASVGLFQQNGKQNYSGGPGGATSKSGQLKLGAAAIGGALGKVNYKCFFYFIVIILIKRWFIDERFITILAGLELNLGNIHVVVSYTCTTDYCIIYELMNT